MWWRVLRWIVVMAGEALGQSSPPEGEMVFVAIRSTKGRVLYKEGPYTQSLAFSEAKRYAKLIEVSGMDSAVQSIRREMEAR